jgi:hypothetical protein
MADGWSTTIIIFLRDNYNLPVVWGLILFTSELLGGRFSAQPEPFTPKEYNDRYLYYYGRKTRF